MAKKKSISHDFKTTAEGKLVIEEKEQPEEMETEGKRKKGNRGGNLVPDNTGVPVLHTNLPGPLVQSLYPLEGWLQQ